MFQVNFEVSKLIFTKKVSEMVIFDLKIKNSMNSDDQYDQLLLDESNHDRIDRVSILIIYILIHGNIMCHII